MKPIGLATALLVLATTLRAQAPILVPSTIPTIQGAIASAQPGDMVLVAPGTYFETLDFLGKTVSVCATQGPAVTTIDAGGAGSAVRFSGGEGPATLLDGFSIRNGVGASGAGATAGGIACSNASPTIRSCVITANQGGSGLDGTFGMSGEAGQPGGVRIDSGAPRFEDCVISANVAGDGGNGGAGILPSSGGVGAPGGLLVLNGSATLIGCRIEDNVASGGGDSFTMGPPGRGGAGAIEVLSSALVLESCALRRNTGGTGGLPTQRGGTGALLVIGATSSVLATSSLFADNQAGNGGPFLSPSSFSTGAIAAGMGAGLIELHGCTIAANTATAGGAGGIDVQAVGVATVLTNTIVWNNTGAGQVAGTPLVSHSDIQGGFAGTGNIAVDPRFVDAAGEDYHLLADSPCIGAGDNAATTASTDVDGDPRVVDGLVDIGADEACLEGSREDFRLRTLVNAAGDPDRCVVELATGDQLAIEMTSPGGGFAFAPALLIADLVGGGPPPSIAGYPEVHVGLATALIVLTEPFLPPAGSTTLVTVGSGPPGLTIRVQAIVLSGSAGNGIFAASRAHDITLL